MLNIPHRLKSIRSDSKEKKVFSISAVGAVKFLGQSTHPLEML